MLTVTVAPTALAQTLCTLTALKSELKITASSDDDHLERVMRQVSRTIARACLRPHFGRETVQQTERMSGPRREIILDRDLEPSISSITEDGVALTADDWEVEAGLVYRLRQDRRCVWSPCKLVLTYQAGYVLPDSVPPDLERACIIACKAAVLGRGRDPALRSETDAMVGSFSYRDPEDDSPALPTEVLGMLEPWKRRAK